MQIEYVQYIISKMLKPVDSNFATLKTVTDICNTSHSSLWFIILRYSLKVSRTKIGRNANLKVVYGFRAKQLQSVKIT